MTEITPSVIDSSFTVSLTVLYVCVGISQGANKEVFFYLFFIS